MASLNSRIQPASSHTRTHFLSGSAYDGVHEDYLYCVDDAFFRMDLAHPGPGPCPDLQGDYSSYDRRLHLEQALLNDCADVQLMSSLMIDDAAAYAYGSPASLLSTPQPEPLSQYAYDQRYPSSLSPPLDSHLGMGQHSSMSVDPWMARDAIPAQSAYSTISDALGCPPADVYTPTSPPASMQQAASSSSSSYPSSSFLSSLSSYDSSNPEVISTPHRNTAVSPNARPVLSTDPTKCPFCPYVQRNMRDPDIRQHLRTHTRSSQNEDFTSCGVPLAEAQDVQSDLDPCQYSSISVDPLAAGGTIPVQNAYSTIVDAFGCYPADVYAPTSSPASTMAPSPPTEPMAVFSELQVESAPESRERECSPVYQRVAYSSSSPSPSASSWASSPSPSASSSASSPFSSASSWASSPSPSASSSDSSQYSSSKPEVIHTPRRNIAVSPNARPIVSKNPLKCTYCPYVAPKGRLPDLTRHVNTHTRSKKDESFKCCGVPLACAQAAGVPTERMKEKPLVYQKIEMVGGCRKAFSRRDALLRHLRDNKGVCFGDAHAPYLLGNQ